LPSQDGATFDIIASLSLERTLISASQVNSELGFLAFGQCDAEIVSAMINRAGRTILTADRSKFITRSVRRGDAPLESGIKIACDQHPGARFQMWSALQGYRSPGRNNPARARL
jgi:DeoR family glycerol-3-phosphate regulon repressor